MGAWEQLVQQAQAGSAGKRTTRLKPPVTPLKATSAPNPTATLPPGLSGAISALTAAERALLDNPARLSALVAEIPTGWETWPIANRRDWVRQRLGLPLTALCDNAPLSDTQPPDPAMQQASLLPDTAILSNNLTTYGPAVATVSAAELLTGAGVAVCYAAEPAQAERALLALAALPDNGPWGLDIETMPLPAFRTDSKAGLDPWRSLIRLVQVYPGGPTCYVFDIAALGLSPLRELLQARAFVAHNAVFELKFLLHHGAAPARLGCTLLQDNALGNGRRALATLARERLTWVMDKTLQLSDWTAANLTPAQVDYAALDAVASYRLARAQTDLLKARDLARCYQLRVCLNKRHQSPIGSDQFIEK